MPAQSDDNLHLEIGHVLFIDIVGYSKLLIEEQKERLNQLTEIVLATGPVSEATDEQLVRLPTGDGMALVFHHSAEEPAECALEIAEALQKHPELPVRMGIHSGPVSEVKDVSGRTNIAGAGINMAQRVMDCGDAGHILLSQHVADDLVQYRQWAPRLHDLGDCEVKHGVRLRLVNLYAEPLGNATLPQKFQQAAEKQAAEKAVVETPARSSSLRRGAAIAAVVILAASAVYYCTSYRTTPSAAIPEAAKSAPIREKSIAVLPFENLSSDKENAYFADGVQDELLTKLARIAELKVISRTSTAKYKSKPEDLKTVSRQLGVATVLEGTVQRAEGKVRVNVQLIDAGADAHLWADSYDRPTTDIFAVESDIATRVANALQATLTGAERKNIAAPPTENSEAHDLYFRAKYLVAKSTHEDTLRAIGYYQEAVAKDPNYALAYAGLSEAYASDTSYSRMPAGELLALARVAAEKALAINRDLPEAHISLGVISLSQLNIKEAKGEFETAIALSWNLSDAHLYRSALLTCIGEFDASLVEARRAIELDPLSLPVRQGLGSAYRCARRYPEAMKVFESIIQLDPAYAQAQDALGMCMEFTGDLDGAVAQFKKSFQASGGDFHSLVFLAHCYGVKGERDKAMETLAQAKELEQKTGAEWAYGYALIYMALGDHELAIDWLERSYQTKESFALLLGIKVDPLLDPLRGNRRFEALANKIILPNAS